MTLRVLQIVTPEYGYTFSGHAQYIFSLIRRWDTQGISLSYFGTDFVFTHGSKAPPQVSSPVRQSNSQIRKLLWVVKRLNDVRRRLRDFDIIHAHAISRGGYLLPLVAHYEKRKAVYTITRQDHDNPSSVRLSRLGPLKVALYRRFDGVIGLSPALVEDCLANQFGAKLLVLPSFLLLEELEDGRNNLRRAQLRDELGIDQRATVMLLVGSIIHRKGIDLAIDAFIHLARERKDLYLVLVGPKSQAESRGVDERYVAEQMGKVAAAKLDDRVVWAGWVRDSDRLAGFYHLADIFVLPTRSEGLGNVLIEAMAAELAVVATRLEGVTDSVISHEKTGLLVKRDHQEGFISAIRTLADNPIQRQAIAASARRDCIAKYSYASHCVRLAGFYRRVAGPRFNSASVC